MIFDFDGIILDSETPEFESHRRIYEQCGVELTREEWCGQIGTWSEGHEARWHAGAARITLEAGVPLVPAGIAGTDQLARLGPLRVAYGPPPSDRRAFRRGTIRCGDATGTYRNQRGRPARGGS